MVALNGVALEPVDARAIVRYLADHQGLAPEEAKAADFEVERKMIDYHYSDKDTERTCSACHSMGRVISQRRTKDEWGLLVAMHRGYYPLADSQGFLNGPGRGGAGADADESTRDQREPMDKAIDQLSKAFPLRTPEWAAWSATLRPPRLEGQWALNGYQPGKGPIFGRNDSPAIRQFGPLFLHDGIDVHVRAERAHRHTQRAGDRVHRLSVARPVCRPGRIARSRSRPDQASR